MTITQDEDVPRPSTTISDHPAHHPGHKLKRVANDGRFFVCDGCFEPGAGTRYRCEHERCNFDLHTCCAVAPDTLTHPLFGDDRVFLFLLQIKPPATATNGKRSVRICVACGDDVRGFVYHCFDDDGDDGLDLHPCCARLLPEHALLDGPVSARGREAPSSRPQDMSEFEDGKRSREIDRRPPAARHRRWAGAGRQQAAVQDRPPENTQLDVQGFELRHQEASSRPRDMSHDRNRGRERRHPAARHRWWRR